MPQLFNNAVITNAGARLIAKSLSGEVKIEFTKVSVGDGIYDAGEKQLEALQERKALKSWKNDFPLSNIEVYTDHSVRVTTLITNQNPVTAEVLVEEGYYINEIGLYAKEKGEADETEILYSITTTSGERGDFLPPYNGYNPAQIIQDYYATVGNAAEVEIKIMPYAVALAEDLLEVRETIHTHMENLENPHEVTPEQLGIEPGANKYIHPQTHPADMIEQDEGHRFVTDIEKSAWGLTFEQATGYTDQEIAKLINGAPTTLDTLGEIATAMQANQDVVSALNQAIGTKANQEEMDSQLGTKLNKTGDASEVSVAFSQAAARANLTSGEKLKVSLGKIMKWFADLANGAASTLLGANLTANRALVANASGKVAAAGVSSTELGYLSGVTSGIQGQLNSLNTGKAATNHSHSYLPLTGGTVTGAITAPSFVGQLSGNATNADKLGGYYGSEAQAANTYVRRNNSGYTFHSYINSSSPNNENPAISQVVVTNGSDNFYRKASLAHLKSYMGLNNVDNTADSSKSVNYAVTAGSATDLSARAPMIRADYQVTVADRTGVTYKPIHASAFVEQSIKSSKENFSSITDEEALNLLKIPPMHFDYINGEKNQSGLIAEDVEPFFPEICAYQTDSETGEKKLFGLDYSKFSPYIVKLLQVQEERIERLEGQIKKEKFI